MSIFYSGTAKTCTFFMQVGWIKIPIYMRLKINLFRIYTRYFYTNRCLIFINNLKTIIISHRTGHFIQVRIFNSLVSISEHLDKIQIKAMLLPRHIIRSKSKIHDANISCCTSRMIVRSSKTGFELFFL